MRFFLKILFTFQLLTAKASAADLKYIHGLYLSKNCEYFAMELKKSWQNIPEKHRNEFLAKLVDCSAERGQIEFADSILKNLDKQKYTSSILNQARAKLDLSRNDFKKIVVDYENQKPTKGTFQYYIYVAQSYYEVDQYDNSLRILSYISPARLTDLQKNIIRYWKAKNYFLKKEYEKADYFVDLILESEEKSWVKDSAQVLKNTIVSEFRPFSAVIYFNGTYDTNTNKQSVANTITTKEIPQSYIIDGTYQVNPSLDFYLKKDQKIKSFINLDLNFAWSSQVTSNQSQTYLLRYRNLQKINSKNTFNWDIGINKAETEFKESFDSTNSRTGNNANVRTGTEGLIRIGLFHLLTSDQFIHLNYKYSKNIRFDYISSHLLSGSLFSIFDDHQIYGTLSYFQRFDQRASYDFDGVTAPEITTGTAFSNYRTTTAELAYKYNFNDQNSLRAQYTVAASDYAPEVLPSGSAFLTNSTKDRFDQTQSLSAFLIHEYSDAINLEFFATRTQGRTQGHQGYLANNEFINNSFIANQFGINLDWIIE